MPLPFFGLSLLFGFLYVSRRALENMAVRMPMNVENMAIRIPIFSKALLSTAARIPYGA